MYCNIHVCNLSWGFVAISSWHESFILCTVMLIYCVDDNDIMCNIDAQILNILQDMVLEDVTEL